MRTYRVRPSVFVHDPSLRQGSDPAFATNLRIFDAQFATGRWPPAITRPRDAAPAPAPWPQSLVWLLSSCHKPVRRREPRQGAEERQLALTVTVKTAPTRTATIASTTP